MLITQLKDKEMITLSGGRKKSFHHQLPWM